MYADHEAIALVSAAGTALAGAVGVLWRELVKVRAEIDAARSRPSTMPSTATSSGSFPAHAGRDRVLVVDDEPSYARAVRHGLLDPESNLDVDVDIAHDAQGAIALAAMHGYAVILADVHLGFGSSMPGTAMLDRIRTRTILHTGLADADVDRLLAERRFDKILVKGEGLDPIVAAVREALEERRGRRP